MTGEASQKFVPIKTIHEGILELDDGSFVTILITNSLNLALKSAEEQTAIISQFQNFFNSLDFSLQIFARSRRANIDGYISTLQERLKFIDADLLRLQTAEYIEYIKNFVAEVNIMEKQFFVVVPYMPALAGGKSLGGISTIFSANRSSVEESQHNLMMVKQQLEERVSVVVSGLSRCGLKLKKLETEEVVDLFYELFNPGGESKTLVS